MIPPFRFRFPKPGKSHLACLAPAKRARKPQKCFSKRQFPDRRRPNWLDDDVKDMQLDAADRLKRYSGSEFLAPFPKWKKKLPIRYSLPDSTVVNLRSRKVMQDLRLLLGYAAPDTEATYWLRRYFEREGTKQPPRFVSLDTEYLPIRGPLQKFHLGVSIFDTRTLEAFRNGSPNENHLEPAVQSHHYVVNDPFFFYKKTRQFPFRDPETISVSDLAVNIKEQVLPPTIIVAHGPVKEFQVLKRLGVSLDRLYVFDTSLIPRELLQDPYAPTLGGLLQKLGIPYEEHLLHVAGNDARFTLQALLMMIAMDAERYIGSSELPSWVSTFRAIAQAKLPDLTTLTPMTRQEEILFRQRESRRLRQKARRHRRFEEARLLRKSERRRRREERDGKKRPPQQTHWSSLSHWFDVTAPS
ncbi:hypothetical protein CEP51_010122 [Fusarium floridanum]|uniref:Gfd2/YDR514C-like C-terminal domain-containing protein n=1 Tax=Fusarium floridanum TaxID=1325733 RepID=A0A428RFH7_9HYPO|nr:hypothetical protein CEP51_010122 [Fusarium floridanum]